MHFNNVYKYIFFLFPYSIQHPYGPMRDLYICVETGIPGKTTSRPVYTPFLICPVLKHLSNVLMFSYMKVNHSFAFVLTDTVTGIAIMFNE